MHNFNKVLSESVSNALKHTGGNKALETCKFTTLFDKFFDMLNVGNFTNGARNRKPFQRPYRHSDDFRLAVCSNYEKFIENACLLAYVNNCSGLRKCSLAIWMTGRRKFPPAQASIIQKRRECCLVPKHAWD